MDKSRYGRIKGKTEFSIYDFGVIDYRDAGPRNKFDHTVTEIDARFVTPTGMAPEVQISVTVTNVYKEANRAVAAHGSMCLTPETAEALALRLAPRLAAFDDLLAALEIAAATVELHTENGAQTQPSNWPRDKNGDIDYEAVAKIARAAIAEAKAA